MSTLTVEVRNVQNAALGSVLLWRFSCAFTRAHKTSGSPALPLSYLVLPILLHADTFALVKGTKTPTGLHGFADKFSRSEFAQGDVLLGIQPRAIAWRSFTRESLKVACACRLLSISATEATTIPLTFTPPTGVPASIQPLLINAEKLGEWLAPLTLFEVGSILKVAF